METSITRPYWLRFVIAFVAAFVLVIACSVSMQVHILHKPEQLLAACIGVLIISIPCSAIAALVFRRSELALVLGAQVLTVVALCSWFGLRA